MVLIVDAAGDEDARALGQEDLGLRAALGVDEVAAVDDGGGQGAEIDLGAGQRLPGRAGAPLEELCRMVEQVLEGIATLDERQALGAQRLELERAELGAVLLELGREEAHQSELTSLLCTLYDVLCLRPKQIQLIKQN